MILLFIICYWKQNYINVKLYFKDKFVIARQFKLRKGVLKERILHYAILTYLYESYHWGFTNSKNFGGQKNIKQPVKKCSPPSRMHRLWEVFFFSLIINFLNGLKAFFLFFSLFFYLSIYLFFLCVKIISSTVIVWSWISLSFQRNFF